jgi:beta-lactamase superfamily II metal-dependent hydrolase
MPPNADPLPARDPVEAGRETAGRRGLRRRAFLLGLVGLAASAALSGQPAGSDTAGSVLRIRFLDVGQADAALITMGRRAVLVDAGRGDDIVLVLAEYGVDSLIAAIASHNHDDHIGGMDAVIADYPIGVYLANGRPPANRNARSVEQWLFDKRVARPSAPWKPLVLGDAKITVFASTLDPARASENNSSLGVLVERGSFRALLTGDSEAEELAGWLEAGLVPDVDVLKAAHHGARNGVTPGWLDRTRPEVVVISVGARNAYGHPDPWAMRYYQLHGRAVYRTDLDGTVEVKVDREGRYRITTAGPIAR